MSCTMYKNIKPFDFRGLQIRELTQEKLSSASIAEIEVPVYGKHPTARSIKSDKLYLCIGGSVTFNCDNRKIKLTPKDVLVIPKGEWFSYQNKGISTARLILVHVPPFSLDYEEFRESE